MRDKISEEAPESRPTELLPAENSKMSRSGAQLLRSSYGQDEDAEGTAVFTSLVDKTGTKLNSQEVSNNSSIQGVLSASSTLQEVKAGMA